MCGGLNYSHSGAATKWCLHQQRLPGARRLQEADDTSGRQCHGVVAAAEPRRDDGVSISPLSPSLPPLSPLNCHDESRFIFFFQYCNSLFPL